MILSEYHFKALFGFGKEDTCPKREEIIKAGF